MPQDIGFGDEIFVVDDDPGVRAALSAVFSREGYRVTCFVDGTSFLAAARARTPACIVLDVHIPGRPGLEVLKELNAHNYAAPIFMISGRGDIPMAVDAVKNGAFDFIEKPFRGSDVVARVRPVLDDIADRHRGEAVLVVSHGAAIVATLAVLAFAPGRSTRVDNGASVLLEHDADGWRLG